MVEGKKCHIVTRKKEFKGLHRDPITNAVMALYRLSLNCSVEVAQSLVMDDKERQIRDNLNVHYQVGDTLEAGTIRIYVDSKRNGLKFKVEEGVSGRHGANIASTNVRTVGMIQTTLSTFSKLLGHSNKSFLSFE